MPAVHDCAGKLKVFLESLKAFWHNVWSKLPELV